MTHHPTTRSDVECDVNLARALGWGSLGIGLAELAAPAAVQQAMGLDDEPQHRGILQVLGVRELMHGVGILADARPTKALAGGVWARVVGDILDTALLGLAATKTRRPVQFAAVAGAVMAIGAADLLCATRLERRNGVFD